MPDLDLTPLIDDNDDNVHQREKRCCCDSKRGIITVNITSLVLTALLMIAWSVTYNDPNLDEKLPDQAMLDHFNKYYTPAMIMNWVALCMDLIVIFGARIYNKTLVALGIVFIIVRLVFLVVVELQIMSAVRDDSHGFLYVWPMFWAVYMLYWHGLFIMEVNRGIMSPHTYPREKYSCCGCA